MDKRRVRLNINGVVCGLITGESEEYMQTLADEVGDLMKQIMDASPFITREAAALTTALSICDDCHKNADLARRLNERKEELEVEAELWQEEKVELLKSAVDTQKDAQLAEKAARLAEKASRLESENTLLEERMQGLLEMEARAHSLEDENAALRQAAKAAQGPSQRELRLEAENRELTGRLAALEERLAQTVKESAPAPEPMPEPPAEPAPEPIKPKPKPKRRRGNPLRQEPDMDQEGMVSFFQMDAGTSGADDE